MGSKLSMPWVCTLGVGAVFGLSTMVKERIGGGMYEGVPDLSGKVCIVTGANTGLGKETVQGLAKRNAKVVMACRNMIKCETARADIIHTTRNKYIYCRPCDLASQESIRRFARDFKKEHGKLHLLVNNAGVMRCPLSHTAEGIEMQLGVNHMGHFLLTNLLLDLLIESAPSRIVNVSSAAHARGKIDRKDLNSQKQYDPGEAYARSKLANILFTRELARKLKGTGVTVNAIHPGIVDTDITRHMSFYNSWFSTIFLKPFLWPFTKVPRQGAQYILRLALDPEYESVSGAYISKEKVSKASGEGVNDELAKWLWLTSEKWTKLNTM